MTVTKYCSSCATLKALELFHKDNSKSDGRCSTCADCAKIKVKKWALNNREYVLAKLKIDSKVRYQKNQAKERQRRKEWRLNNPDYFKNYLNANRSAHIARTAKRKASKFKAIPAWADKNKIKTIYEKCRLMRAITEIQYEVDHIVPLQSERVCGLHCEANLRIITKLENSSKRNLHWPDMP